MGKINKGVKNMRDKKGTRERSPIRVCKNGFATVCLEEEKRRTFSGKSTALEKRACGKTARN